MKSIKVLIVEDQPAEAGHLRDTLKEMGYEVAAIAENLSDGLDYFHRFQPDVSLVDIYLNGRADGIVFGKTLHEQDSTTPFLFLTSAIEPATFSLAKSSAPSNYLLKPFNKPELQYAIELALQRSQASVASEKSVSTRRKRKEEVFVKRGNTLFRTRYDDMMYVEVEGKYSKIVCRDQKFVVQQSLCDLYDNLPRDQFLRIHRSYIINMKQIQKIDVQSHELFFKEGESLYFSRRYLDEFLGICDLIK